MASENSVAELARPHPYWEQDEVRPAFPCM